MCPGCGEQRKLFGMVGIWLRGDGKPVLYALCDRCTQRVQTERETVFTEVELRIGSGVEGHA